MKKPIIEKVSEIMEAGKFSKTKKSDSVLRKEVQDLFRLYAEEEGSDAVAKKLHDKIIKLAEYGKGDMVNEFAMKYEREITDY